MSFIETHFVAGFLLGPSHIICVCCLNAVPRLRGDEAALGGNLT